MKSILVLLVSIAMAAPASTAFAATSITISNSGSITNTTTASASTGGNVGGTVVTGSKTARARSFNYCPTSCTIVSSTTVRR